MTTETKHDGPENDEELVGRALLSQHEQLRVLLAALDERARAVVRAQPIPGPDLRSALEAAAAALSNHIRDEERILATIRPPSRAWNESLARLHEDHVGQLEEVQRMRRLATTSDDAISLAMAVRAFVDDVRLDMDVEDRRFSLALDASHRATLHDSTCCLDCRDAIAPALDRVFAVRKDEAICMECARRRGGVYDEGADRWQTEPRVDDLTDHAVPAR